MTPPACRAHAGAIIALADETVPAAARRQTIAGEFCPEPFPLTLHMSAHEIRIPNLVPAPPAMTAPEDRQGP